MEHLKNYFRAVGQLKNNDGRHWLFPIKPSDNCHSISNYMGINYVKLMKVFEKAGLLVIKDIEQKYVYSQKEKC